MEPNCSQFQYQELLYLADELTSDERLGFEQHLKNCSECTRRLKEAETVLRQLRPGGLVPSQESLRLIKSKIREQLPVQVSWFRIARWAGVAVAAGICLVILSQILIKPPVEDKTIIPRASAFVWNNGNYSELDSLARGIRALELGWDEAAVDIFDAEDSLDEINQSIKQLRKEL